MPPVDTLHQHRQQIFADGTIEAECPVPERYLAG
jgi:hypothetical protein